MDVPEQATHKQGIISFPSTNQGPSYSWVPVPSPAACRAPPASLCCCCGYKGTARGCSLFPVIYVPVNWYSDSVLHLHIAKISGLPGGSDGKESVCNAGDPSLILGSGRSPGEGNGYTLQYSCLENPMDRGDWQATV